MSERNVASSRAARAETDDYIRTVAATQSPAAQIESSKRLLDSGAVTVDEYNVLKAKALQSA